MTAPVVVEPVSGEAGCAPVRALAVAHALYERSATEVPPDWAARVAQLITADRVDLLVARTGGTAVGYATVTTEVATWSATDYAHLDCLFVDAGWRGRGIGKLLLRTAADRARSRGVCEVQWQTPASNHDAIRFYRRFGATAQQKERFTLALAPEPDTDGRTPARIGHEATRS